MKGFTLKIPFMLPGLTVVNFVQTHPSSVWHLHEHPHSCSEVCSAGTSPFPHTTLQNRTVFLDQGHASSTAEVQNTHKQTPLPSAWLWHEPEQRVYLNTPKHNTMYKLNSVYPAELSAGTQLRDFSCTASFCPCQQQQYFRKVVSHHSGILRGGDILSCDLGGVLQTQQSTNNPWHFRTASEGSCPQAQIMNVSSARRFSPWKQANRRYLSLLGRNWNLSAEIQGIFWLNYKLSTDLCRGDLIKLGKIKGKTGGGVPDLCFAYLSCKLCQTALGG